MCDLLSQAMTVEQLRLLSESQKEAITVEQQRAMSSDQLEAIRAGEGTRSCSNPGYCWLFVVFQQSVQVRADKRIQCNETKHLIGNIRLMQFD